MYANTHKNKHNKKGKVPFVMKFCKQCHYYIIKTTQIVISHRIAWRRSWRPSTMCDSSHIGTMTTFNAASEELICDIGCSSVLVNLNFFCTDINLLEDWVTGAGSNVYNISTSVDYFEAS